MGCQRKQVRRKKRNDKFAAYAKAFPQEAAEFTRRMKVKCRLTSTQKANEFIAKLQANPSKIAMAVKASQNAIEAFGPWLQENSSAAPLTPAPSNLTL